MYIIILWTRSFSFIFCDTFGEVTESVNQVKKINGRLYKYKCDDGDDDDVKVHIEPFGD